MVLWEVQLFAETYFGWLSGWKNPISDEFNIHFAECRGSDRRQNGTENGWTIECIFSLL
jgi:hypothetical protein